jgi:CheY-like chemotaxis protein
MIPDIKEFFSRQNIVDETSFSLLMRKRIYNVLLISSVYDAFILEEDGRIEEQIFNEYSSLNLRYPPRFLKASSEEKALKILGEENIDLVIMMLSLEEEHTYSISETIKRQFPKIPIVLLSPFSRESYVKRQLLNTDIFDFEFSWLGNADLLLAIIKVIEDRMNAEFDVKKAGVQVIILVEDNVRFYSSYLPSIYKIIMKQSKLLITEGLNEHQKMLRARGRPKILVATNYEEALNLYETYKDYLLGIISDVSYPRNGKKDSEAGLHLFEKIKQENRYLPMLLQSSNLENEKKAKALKVGFLNKNSKKLNYELREFIKTYFAFGDFVFKDPDTGKEVARAHSLKDLQEKIFSIPSESLQYHISRNHFSKWLRARALFSLALLFQSFTHEDFNDCDEVKSFIFNAIANFRLKKSRGVIAKFDRTTFDEYFSITRIGEGSIGGKARGLAFLDSMINRNGLYHFFDGVDITIPKTIVISTDVFDEFMEQNSLYPVALSDDIEDSRIFEKFIDAKLPDYIEEDLFTIITKTDKPLVIRSSSLLEDSHYQPFAGIYNTYMIPLLKTDLNRTHKMLLTAIKSVYASAFLKESKAYMQATSNVIDEEKMAIVIQEVCGSAYGDKFYPTISGVARSLNYYPIHPEKAEDGIANIALGLGKYIVDGGLSLRFSPKYPRKIIQLSSPEMALRETQKHFYALSLNPDDFNPDPNDSVNLKKLPVKQADKDGSIQRIASTFDFKNQTVIDSYNYDGKKLITFAPVLKYNILPLAGILQKVLSIGQKEMDKPVEIEFAVDLNKKPLENYKFNLLQIRPIALQKESVNLHPENIDKSRMIIISNSALGNGITDDVYDVVYIKPQTFNAANNEKSAKYVNEINERFLKEGKNYILIGPGRWGSSDPWLGIPVKWPDISAARLIIESGLENYRIDPSQGTHFFQNLTSFRVGYFTVNPFIDDGYYDIEFLNNTPAVYENEVLRHVSYNKPLIIKIDGKKSFGIVKKPEL